MQQARASHSRSVRVTIADVAALAGVSRAAVSKVFNEHGGISEATSQRIRDAARKLNWTPSPAAVALRLSRMHTVGLVINRGVDSLEVGASISALISGLESVLTPHGYGLLLYVCERDSGEEEGFYRRVASSRRVDGIILTDSLVGDTRFELMRSLAMPAILIGTPWREDPILHVDSKPPAAGIAESVEHLLGLGHRRIGYVGGPNNRVPAVMRRIAFEESILSAGLNPVAVLAADYSAKGGAAQAAKLFDLPEQPTAIIFGSDAQAIGGLRAAKLRGIRVPEDLSVVGYDGLEIGEWIDPGLTTVHRSPIERGRTAAVMLLNSLGETVNEERPLQPYLLIRGSTGPVNASKRV